MTYVLVFLAVTALDYAFAEYTKATADRGATRASLWAAAIVGLSGFAAISYVGDHWCLIPGALGSFVGTYLSVKFGK